MDEQLYLVKRLQSSEVNIGTIYNHTKTSNVNTEQIKNAIMSDSNVEHLVDKIIERADPLRNGNLLGVRPIVKDKVDKFLLSWNNLGRFDKITIPFEGKTYNVKTVSPVALLDHYNKEFVDTFAETILPYSDPTKVTSVVNPNGMYAHQERILRINSKPVPFYERSIYKRLHDTKLDQRIDETESPFYRLDYNPRMPNTERKKRDVDTTQLPSYLDRQGIAYRMKPKY